MTAKEYLGQIQALDVKIQQKIAERDSLRRALVNTSNIRHTTSRSSTDHRPTEKLIEKLMTLEHDVDVAIDAFVTQRNKVIDQIHSLQNPIHIDLLYKRYVEYKRLEVIAVEMHYSYIWVRQLHSYALSDFERAYTNIQTDML